MARTPRCGEVDRQSLARSRVHFLGVLLAGLVVLALLADSFATAMLRSDHNEHMYVAAGALLADGKTLYSDFSYVQMPLLPHLYGALYRLSGADQLLLLQLLTRQAVICGLRRFLMPTLLALASQCEVPLPGHLSCLKKSAGNKWVHLGVLRDDDRPDDALLHEADVRASGSVVFKAILFKNALQHSPVLRR